MGLYTQDALDMMTGIAETKGVILLTSPHVPIKQTTANGVQDSNHSVTLVMDTFAMRISAETWSCSELLRKEVTFIFLACSRSSFSCRKTAWTML